MIGEMDGYKERINQIVDEKKEVEQEMEELKEEMKTKYVKVNQIELSEHWNFWFGRVKVIKSKLSLLFWILNLLFILVCPLLFAGLSMYCLRMLVRIWVTYESFWVGSLGIEFVLFDISYHVSRECALYYMYINLTMTNYFGLVFLYELLIWSVCYLFTKLKPRRVHLKHKVSLLHRLDEFHQDLRSDAHAHGDERHSDPMYAVVEVSTYRKKKGYSGLFLTDYKVDVRQFTVSLEILSQFCSAEKTSMFCNFQDNKTRILRAMKSIASVNYSRYKFMEGNVDILDNCALIAQYWTMAKAEKQMRFLQPQGTAMAVPL
jgi:hypothetical protein